MTAADLKATADATGGATDGLAAFALGLAAANPDAAVQLQVWCRTFRRAADTLAQVADIQRCIELPGSPE